MWKIDTYLYYIKWTDFSTSAIIIRIHCFYIFSVEVNDDKYNKNDSNAQLKVPTTYGYQSIIFFIFNHLKHFNIFIILYLHIVINIFVTLI